MTKEEKMTPEEAIAEISFLKVAVNKVMEQALDMAIKALSQEPCQKDCRLCKEFDECVNGRKGHENGTSIGYSVGECKDFEPCDDAISRTDAIKALTGWETEPTDEEIEYTLNKLPSVTQKSGKWIPVSERLPEDEQEILFSTKTGRVHSGKYHDDDSANQWYSHRDKCRAWNNVVSAWMPLPKPYEPKESEDKE